eukprot:XP_001694707.1 predicted protein [Chlamydomonas reinhardtii]
MTRTKGASQAARPHAAVSKDENEPMKKAAVGNNQPAGKRSREVLSLLNTAVLLNSGTEVGGRSRGRASVAEARPEQDQRQPAGRGKKGLSAPPAPALPFAASQQQEPVVPGDKRATAVTRTDKTRFVAADAGAETAPAAEPAKAVADKRGAPEHAAGTHQPGAKKRKVSRSSDSGQDDAEAPQPQAQAAKPKQKGSGNASAAAAAAAAEAAGTSVVPVEAGAEKKRKSKSSGDGKAALEQDAGGASRPGQPSADVPLADAPAKDASVAGPSGSVAAGIPAAQLVPQAEDGAGAKRTRKQAAAAAAALQPAVMEAPPPIVTMPMPRMDEVGQRERSAVVELQRQLVELRGMYDELKSTKIHELEKVLAEQVQYTEEQVRHAEQKAKLWQAAAEHAEQKAKAAGSEEVASRIASLEAQAQQLLAEKGELLLRVAQQERELAQTQQALHDMRAELMLAGQGQQQQQHEGGEAQVHGAGATPADANGAAAGRSVQFPSITPGPGVLFPTPGTQLVRMRGFLGSGIGGQSSGETPSATGPGVSTECLRVVNMLPSLRAVSTEDGGSAPLSGAATGGTGLNTHCQRVVNMLPQLRAPTPSIQSRLASGADQYSFVDLNPASARKGPPPTEGPLAPGLAGFSPRAAAAAAIAAARAALALDSGNNSNQGSCSGLVARAAAQQECAQEPEAATGDGSATAAQGGTGTPMSARKLPAASAAAAGPGADQAAAPVELPAALSPAANAGQPTAQAQAELAMPGSPSPRTAKLIMYERMLDWHVDTVSLRPEACRLTHLGCGMSFELRETELDEEELADLAEQSDAVILPGTKFFQYTLLQPGSAGDCLPEHLKDEIKIPADQRRPLLHELDKAIKAHLANQQPVA